MDNMKLHFDVDGEDFTRAGEASGETKRVLKGLGFDANVIRNVSIAMYEGEINMVIHAGGGEIDVEISPECISMVLADHGPGIENVELAMQEGYSTAPDKVRALGFDDRFIRKWSYYLSYCEAAFALRNISVVHTVHTRPNNLGLR